MECPICYEKFIIPKTNAELQEEIKKMNKIFEGPEEHSDKCNKLFHFENLLISPKHNPTHACSTPNCNCIICGNCWERITCGGTNFQDMEPPSIYKTFKCPYCRNIDWKYYMNNVFNELQIKVLGLEEFGNLMWKKYH